MIQYQHPTNRLIALLDALSLDLTKAHLEPLGRKLATYVGRSSPFSYKHLHSIGRGDFTPGAVLNSAIDAALAAIDGADPFHAGSRQGAVMVPKSWEGDLAYLPIEPLFCSKDDCLNRFIPNTPKRRKCYTCSPIRRKD